MVTGAGGSSVGSGVGSSVGFSVGASVGASVGSSVGAAVGSGVAVGPQAVTRILKSSTNTISKDNFREYIRFPPYNMIRIKSAGPQPRGFAERF